MRQPWPHKDSHTLRCADSSRSDVNPPFTFEQGVETNAAYTRACLLGLRQAQGYSMSRPVAAVAAAAELDN